MKAVILLSVLAVAFARAEIECGVNQHYDSCGTACPITCENYENPPKFCIMLCKPGCHCDEGFVKTRDGRCVEPEQCPAQGQVSAPKKCGENQHYESCGTACPLTCVNYKNPPKFCVLMCNPGCHCDEGFVKTKDGRCVEPEQCPSQAVCGENARYLECGSACPLTCDNYGNPPKFCPAMCVSGCHCEKGFVKTRDGRCVRPDNCPGRFRAPSEVCSLPVERGLCYAYIPRYYFDAKTGRCQQFIYGGCRGNENNFRTLLQCQKTCGSS